MSTADTVYREIPLDDLHDSPTNPRETFDEASLAELAADIKAHGRVLQPLLVRPRIPELFRGMEDAADTAACGFEIVFGHRRRRGAELAGLQTVTCMVRSMTDAEVSMAQISENLARKDVHPFEEAAGFQALIDRHGMFAEEIAEKTGKSRSYVYARLKLLQACPEVRTACLKGEIGAEAALLVARLRLPKLQEKALQLIKARNQDLADGGKQSHRRIAALLTEHFTLDLDKAPFDIEEEMLTPTAGNCIRCHKRSGNAPEFSDLVDENSKAHQWHRNVGPNVCTDPDCYAEKKAAIFKRQADNLRAVGKTVIDGKDALKVLDAYGRPKGDFLAIDRDSVKAALKAANQAVRKGSQITAPVVYTVQDPATGKTVQAVKASDLTAAGVLTEASTAKTSQAAGYDYEAQRREREAKRAAAQAAIDTRVTHLRDALRGTERTADEARVLAMACLRQIHDTELLATWWAVAEDDEDAWQDRINAMTRDDLALLLLDCALVKDAEVDHYYPDAPTPALDALEALHGLTDEPAATPAAAAHAQAEGGDQTPDEPADAAAGAGADQPPALAKAWPFPRTGSAGANQTDEAGSAGQEQTDDDGCAVGSGAEA